MAAAYLQERDIPLRNFPQVLQSMYSGPDLLPRLVDYLLLIHSEEGGASSQAPQDAASAAGIQPDPEGETSLAAE